jgi:bisphosphoglycerate-independent phosphoglycerate mutase (AlkP superfamily)
VSDQWLPPFVITDEAGKPVGTVEDGDAVVLFNFRADRMVEISKAFEYPDFDIFDRERYPKVCALLCRRVWQHSAVAMRSVQTCCCTPGRGLWLCCSTRQH